MPQLAFAGSPLSQRAPSFASQQEISLMRIAIMFLITVITMMCLITAMMMQRVMIAMIVIIGARIDELFHYVS